ncbi:MAG: cbb3-type cytochrome c oxidase subunit I [Candidatus Methanosuratincola sp.]
MFELSRRYIKTGFLFFVIGLILGFYMMVKIYVLSSWPSRALITAHVHVILFGFVISLIMGVAIWMFPRRRDEVRYSPSIAEAVYWLLTLGTISRFLGEVLLSLLSPALWLKAAILIGGSAQMLAGILFVYNMWSRVRPVGKQR